MLLFLILYIGRRNYLSEVDQRDMTEAMKYTELPDPPAPLEFLKLAKVVMEENQLNFPTHVDDAIALFIELTALIEVEIENA